MRQVIRFITPSRLGITACSEYDIWPVLPFLPFLGTGSPFRSSPIFTFLWLGFLGAHGRIGFFLRRFLGRALDAAGRRLRFAVFFEAAAFLPPGPPIVAGSRGQINRGESASEGPKWSLWSMLVTGVTNLQIDSLESRLPDLPRTVRLSRPLAM